MGPILFLGLVSRMMSVWPSHSHPVIIIIIIILMIIVEINFLIVRRPTLPQAAIPRGDLRFDD